jgi:type II secretory pathway pseudopilin PulG
LKRWRLKGLHGQRGYTLVELIISSGLAAFVLTALTSVIFVTTQANRTWSPRLQATGEIRHFQEMFYDDVAASDSPSTALTTNPCLAALPSPAPPPTPPIALNGLTFTGTPPAAQTFQATYCYNPTSQTVQRYVAGNPTVVARNVVNFKWRLDAADGNALVLDITTTDNSVPSIYSTTQELRYYPRRNRP